MLKNKFLMILVIFLTISISFTLSGQDAPPDYYLESVPSYMQPDSAKIKKKRLPQHQDFVNLRYPFPARPRNMNTIQISGGFANIGGDVDPLMGYGVGVAYRWNVGYVMSMRLEADHLWTFGQNRVAKTLYGDLVSLAERNPFLISRNTTYNGSGFNTSTQGPSIRYADFDQNLAYDNYRTEITELTASLMFTLNNFKFHRTRNRANFYLIAGMGGMLYKSWVDAAQDLDGDGIESDPYNYADVFNQIDDSRNDLSKKEKVDFLKDLYGGWGRNRSYETVGEGFTEDVKFFDRQFRATVHVGVALDFLVTDRFTVGMEVRHTFTQDDLLDGQRWSEQGDLTRRFDTYNYANLKLGLNIGNKNKREVPMWWRNPNQSLYEQMKYQPDFEKFVQDKDTDRDGVPDKLDEDNTTPPGAIVDARGNIKDSDNDGCPDHEDPEPYSTPQLPIVDCKNVYDFATKDCCDEKAQVIGNVVAPCREIELPSIHFDDDKYFLKPEFYAHLHEVARKMQDCPDLKVVANGHTDTRSDVKYNEQLSWNRVNTAIKYLVEKYGISRDRFIVTFSGERAPLNKDESAIEKYQNRRVEFRFGEEGEEGESNPPAPHPGIKAGENK